VQLPVWVAESKAQGLLNSDFQVYVYFLSTKPKTNPCSEIGKKSMLTSMELVSNFFEAHQDLIARELLQLENQNLFKKFYHLRWF